MTEKSYTELLPHKINLETSIISWSELERPFAGGRLILVASSLDLVNVANAFAIDDAQSTQHWIEQGLISHVSDDQARTWQACNAELWAVVIKPWVLVQAPANDAGDE